MAEGASQSKKDVLGESLKAIGGGFKAIGGLGVRTIGSGVKNARAAVARRIAVEDEVKQKSATCATCGHIGEVHNEHCGKCGQWVGAVVAVSLDNPPPYSFDESAFPSPPAPSCSPPTKMLDVGEQPTLVKPPPPTTLPPMVAVAIAQPVFIAQPIQSVSSRNSFQGCLCIGALLLCFFLGGVLFFNAAFSSRGNSAYDSYDTGYSGSYLGGGVTFTLLPCLCGAGAWCRFRRRRRLLRVGVGAAVGAAICC